MGAGLMADPTVKRIAVIGSRDFDDYSRLVAVLEPHLPAVLVSGGAKGADALAERLARERGLTIDVIPADWQRYGRGAGPVRNRQIVESADLVVAFWDGKSRGTRSALIHADKVGVPVEVHHPDGSVTT